jgi:hypothetical protein
LPHAGCPEATIADELLHFLRRCKHVAAASRFVIHKVVQVREDSNDVGDRHKPLSPVNATDNLSTCGKRGTLTSREQALRRSMAASEHDTGDGESDSPR